MRLSVGWYINVSIKSEEEIKRTQDVLLDSGPAALLVAGGRGWVQNILITSLVLSRDLLVPKDGRIVCWGRVRVWRCEVLLNGLLEGIIASEIAELSLWSGEWQYDGKKRREDCVR